MARLTYLGPARTLTLADGTVVERGAAVTLDDETRAGLEKAGLRFGDPKETPPSSGRAAAKKEEKDDG